MVPTHLDLDTDRKFFDLVILSHGVLKRIVINKIGANFDADLATNTVVRFSRQGEVIAIYQSKYLNHIVEQDRRFIKRIT